MVSFQSAKLSHTKKHALQVATNRSLADTRKALKKLKVPKRPRIRKVRQNTGVPQLDKATDSVTAALRRTRYARAKAGHAATKSRLQGRAKKLAALLELHTADAAKSRAAMRAAKAAAAEEVAKCKEAMAQYKSYMKSPPASAAKLSSAEAELAKSDTSATASGFADSALREGADAAAEVAALAQLEGQLEALGDLEAAVEADSELSAGAAAALASIADVQVATELLAMDAGASFAEAEGEEEGESEEGSWMDADAELDADEGVDEEEE